MINDWSAIDVGEALDYLDSCRSYDGAFGQGPRQESHGKLSRGIRSWRRTARSRLLILRLVGGSTYCAVSAYSLVGAIEKRFSQRDRRRLTSWLVARQSQQDTSEGEDHDAEVDGGFNGRINKPQDSCYSFWCGATLAVREAVARRRSASSPAHQPLPSSPRCRYSTATTS